MADVSDRPPDEIPSQPDTMTHCQNLQTYVMSYAETLKSITEVEGLIKNARLLPFLYGAQDLERLQPELRKWIEDRK
ncbi:hypothetical protein NPIL_582881, partial [Nephila pilipes]